MKRKQRLRAFTLIEICIVVSLIGLLVAVAIPAMSRARRRADVRDTARNLIGNLEKARALAAKGGGNAAWGVADQTVSAGIRILSPTQYQVFIDRDLVLDGDEQIIAIVDLAVAHPGTPMNIAAVPAVDVRFRKTGILTTNAPIDLTVTDTNTGDYKVVRVSAGGGVKLAL